MTGPNKQSESSRQPRPALEQRELRASRLSDIRAIRGSAAVATSTDRSASQEQGRLMALRVAAAGLDKKAEDIQIIDVIGKVDYADYIVLMTGASDRNVAAIARGVEEELAGEGVRALALEGLPLGHWVLIDFVDVVVHVFQEEWRRV